MLTRGSKGAALTWSELDSNFIELDTGKVNKTGSDLTGPVNANKGADIASAAAINLGAATGEYVVITGSVGISSLGTAQAGTERNVVFTGSLTLTHNATSLILPGGSNITTAAGDTATFRSEGSGNWRCTGYQPNINGLKLGGTAARITGDFSNATLSNRVMFQTSVANGATGVYSIPNGTNTGAQIGVTNSSDANNATYLDLAITNTEARVRAVTAGSGTALPMTFSTGGAERLRIDPSGIILVGQNQTAQFPGQSLTVTDSGHATSRRASIGIGSAWTLLQDSGGTGTKDFSIFNAGSGRHRMQFDVTGNSTHTDPNGGLGYGPGAGGTVTQSTSKSTAVTINKPCGQITMNNAALAAGAEVFFTVNNTLLNDSSTTVLISPLWSTVSPLNYQCRITYVGANTLGIAVKNISAGSLSEALVINFAIIKGASS